MTERSEGFAFFCWARDYLQRHERVSILDLAYEWLKLQRPRMQKEFAPLYDGDTLIGQQVVYREFNARSYAPFIERIHPDDASLTGVVPDDALLAAGRDVRIQRFNLHKGRYVLAGTET